ncbi:pygopus homolog 2-like [Camelus ferus]|uniref:Pygopus homolog 2-like n=1 Tax=Camelus ferus TaxID=419612 RepID=A0A8B8UF83_CAMFR|nr:pygopus homolog 2-like [Camelus ferus]
MFRIGLARPPGRENQKDPGGQRLRAPMAGPAPPSSGNSLGIGCPHPHPPPLPSTPCSPLLSGGFLGIGCPPRGPPPAPPRLQCLRCTPVTGLSFADLSGQSRRYFVAGSGPDPGCGSKSGSRTHSGPGSLSPTSAVQRPEF